MIEFELLKQLRHLMNNVNPTLGTSFETRSELATRITDFDFRVKASPKNQIPTNRLHVQYTGCSRRLG